MRRMARDFSAILQLEQTVANTRTQPQLIHDLKMVVTPAVRLMFLLFERDDFRAASQAGRHVLKGMLLALPDSKLVEDIHGVIRVDGLSQKNKRQTVHSIQELITQSHVLNTRSIAHKAVVDRNTFLANFKRTPDRKRKRPLTVKVYCVSIHFD